MALEVRDPTIPQYFIAVNRSLIISSRNPNTIMILMMMTMFFFLLKFANVRKQQMRNHQLGNMNNLVLLNGASRRIGKIGFAIDL